MRQNILWGVKQCNQSISDKYGEKFGANGYEIEFHSGARPSHREMGGKQYAKGKARTVNGVYYPPISSVEGLLSDYGCLHFRLPILLGISQPNHSSSELRQLKLEDTKAIDFEGKGYTRYEATQVQRKLETQIRHAKDRQIIAKAAGDDILRREEQQIINTLAYKYNKFSNAMGLPNYKERMSVGGYHKIQTRAEIYTKKLYGLETSIGVKVTEVIPHAAIQAYKRGADMEKIAEALTSPLHISTMKTNSRGENSFQFIGRNVTVALNPDNGKVITIWKTGKSKIKKYEK